VVASLEYAHETSENHARATFTNGVPITGGAPTAPYADLENPDHDAGRLGPLRRTGAYTEAKSDSLAASLFDTIKFNEQWQLQGGLRFDHFETDYKSVATTGVPTKLSRDDDMVSWRSGLVYKPVKQGSIYTAYGTSFNPSAEGLTLSSGATAANNIDTDPEESRTFEIGTKWDLFENRLSLSFAVFRTEKTNARTEDPADGTDIIVLDGEQRVDGLEIGAAGRLTEKWQVYAGYAYLVSEIRKSNNPLEEGMELSNTPKNTFSLWTTYDLPWHLQIGGGAQYVDSRFTSNLNTREAPSYWTFDAMAGWAPNDHFSLRLNVYNLTNEDYIDRVGGGHFVPGAGLTGVLTASLKF
jgi:catecholate siderophore receptor